MHLNNIFMKNITFEYYNNTPLCQKFTYLPRTEDMKGNISGLKYNVFQSFLV